MFCKSYSNEISPAKKQLQKCILSCQIWITILSIREKVVCKKL